MDPNGKVAIVTGGASGLGAATAAALAAAGASVARLDLAPAPSGADAAWCCDVTDEASVAAAIAGVLARFGRIDLCINCAGIGGIGPIATAASPGDIAAFRRVVDVNLTGAAIVTAHAAHHMIGNAPSGPDGERGVIINACSIASFEGQAGMGPYTASKAALAGLTLVWARDLSAHGIRVMGIAPGLFETPMTAGLPDAVTAELLETVEFPKRSGRAAEFADLALAIVRMPMLNATVIRIDGGTRPPARTRFGTGGTGA